MTHSPLTNAIFLSRQSSSRLGATIDTVLLHHQASTNAAQTRDAMVNETKEVSANYIITNEGEIWLIVDEDLRAWTSGSSSDGGKGAAWDRRSITIEIENETGSPDWRISTAALVAMARLLADLRRRYPIRYVYGHRDLWALYSASYPTYCPGPNTVAQVIAIEGGVTPPSGPAPSVPSAPAASVDYAYGLTKAAQLAAQKALARLGRYPGDQDGVFGRLSVKAMQRYLRDLGLLPADYEDDGIPGPTYGRALHVLAARFGYSGSFVGLPGPNVSAAIERWAASTAPSVPVGIPAGRDWSYWEPSGELAKRVQRALIAKGRLPRDYRVDGVFGPLVRKAIQRTLAVGGFPGGMTSPDGVIEREGCLGIQQYAKRFGDYGGPLDRAPREGSWTGFALGLERP